jgi:nitrogen fixation protein NifU and related proteins
MFDDLRSLYLEIIIDHNKNPRNFGILENANHMADGFNPLCGDKLTIYLKMEDNFIKDVKFKATGCAISVASASLMTEELKGKTMSEVETLFDQFRQMVMGECAPDAVDLGKLGALAGVREFPARVKCATLCWHTLSAALHNQPVPATTE